jgi:hypothetical protein
MIVGFVETAGLLTFMDIINGHYNRITDCPRLAEDLYERSQIDLREAFIDGAFAPAKAPRSWQSQTLLVFL